MAKRSTLDLKGLGHGERESLLFPAIEGLGEGDVIRLVVEFNPVPLVYMLKARKEFGISYEKEGPDEWILLIQRTASNEDIKAHFKALLSGLKGGVITEKEKEEAKKLLQGVDATALGIIEQELIREGISHKQIRESLCDIHLEVLRDTLVSQQRKVEAPHPIHTLMEEHKVILKSLEELASITGRLEGKKNLEEMGTDLEALKEAAHHLVEAESHHQREEEALFPRLRAHNVIEPPAIMAEEHVEFRKRKQELYRMAQNPGDYGFKEFREKVISLGNYLTKELESHIFKEDNILYQIALQVLTDREWEEVKRECDKIGYCCFTPADRKEKTGREAMEE